MPASIADGSSPRSRPGPQMARYATCAARVRRRGATRAEADRGCARRHGVARFDRRPPQRPDLGRAARLLRRASSPRPRRTRARRSSSADRHHGRVGADLVGCAFLAQCCSSATRSPRPTTCSRSAPIDAAIDTTAGVRRADGARPGAAGAGADGRGDRGSSRRRRGRDRRQPELVPMALHACPGAGSRATPSRRGRSPARSSSEHAVRAASRCRGRAARVRDARGRRGRTSPC